MIARYQLRNPNALRHENYFGEGIRQLRNKLRRSASVSRQPIDHPGVGGVVVALPCRACRIHFPMRMGEAAGVLVVRITCMSVQERRLRKREHQATGHAEMDQPTYQATLLYLLCLPIVSSRC